MSAHRPLLRTLAAVVYLSASPCSLALAQCDVEVQEFSAPDGQGGDSFGYRVERSGGVLIAAATFDDDLGLDSGSAYVHERDAAGGWVLAKKCLASDGAAGDLFSYSVAVDGASVLIGAPFHDDPLQDRGAVYVFARDQGGPGNWGEVTHFAPPSAGANAHFGYSLAVRGDRLLVGAPHHAQGVAGTAYLYRRDSASASGWSLELEFTSTDPATAFEFGQDVALGDEVLAVSGSRTSVIPYSDSYVIHVRERDAGGPGSWGETSRIESPTGSRDFFAYEVVLDGDLLLSVAPGEPNLTFDEIGALYLYERTAPGQWQLRKRFFSTEAVGGWFTAEEVELEGDWLVAGSPSDTVQGQSSAGALFVFGRNTGGPDAWGDVVRLHDSDPGADALFGLDLSLEGDELVVGAPGPYSGSVGGDVYFLDLARLARASWRNDAAGANPGSHSAGRPLLGSTFRATVDITTTGHSVAALIAFADPAKIPLHGGQVLLGHRRVATAFRSGPIAQFAFSLPDDPALCGVRFTTQAAHFGGVQGFALSNAQDLVLGME